MYGLTLIYKHALYMYRVCVTLCVCFAVCHQLNVLCAREVCAHVA